MFTHILAPYDGSKNADRALDKAAQMAKLTGAKVSLLTVYRHHSMLEASLSMVRVSDPGRIDDAMREHASGIAEHGKSLLRDAGVESVRAFVRSGRRRGRSMNLRASMRLILSFWAAGGAWIVR